MRTGYDSVTASNIPRNAQVVCGYDDGKGLWSAADWALFPNAVHVHISSLGTNTGHVLDCEPGNPNAVQSVDWILQRRAANVDPYVYTAEWAPGYTWADVRAACDARSVPYPHWWKAPGTIGQVGTHDGTEPLMVQYAYPGPYDINEVADYLPGIEDAAGDNDMTADQAAQLEAVFNWIQGTGNNTFYNTKLLETATPGGVGAWVAGTGNATFYNTKDIITRLEAIEEKLGITTDSG